MVNINLVTKNTIKNTDDFHKILINFPINDESDFELEKSGGRLFRYIESYFEVLKLKKEIIESTTINITHELSDRQLALIQNGIDLKAWKFTKYKSREKINYQINLNHGHEFENHYNKLKIVTDSILWARELINTPANDCYAEIIAEEVKKLHFKTCEVTILDEKDMETMTLALKVNAGSPRPPRVIIIKKGENPNLAIVGKGVTFDTGGVSIKPSDKMDEMIYDMAGGAAVLATAKVLDSMDCEFIAIAGFVENCCDGAAQLPGDIYKSRNGKTVQVLNTDAEGRLLLGDLVHYAGELGCKNIITIATLTGAVQVCLGNIHAGVMGPLSQGLIESGKITGETLWELPSDKAYDSFIESKVADIKNISGGRGAGPTVGFKFIEALLYPGTSLTHLDIASMIRNGYAHEDLCDPSFYTAFGIRLLSHFIFNNPQYSIAENIVSTSI